MIDNDATSLTLEEGVDGFPETLAEIERYDLLLHVQTASIAGKVIVSDEGGIVVDEDLVLAGGSELRVHRVEAASIELAGASGLRSPGTTTEPGPDRLYVRAEDMTIDTSSFISTSGRGYAGGYNGAGRSAGNELRAYSREYNGGSHGGIGGNVFDNRQGYGDFRFPIEFGEGGNSERNQSAGNGGGSVIIEVSGQLLFDGTINSIGSNNGLGGGAGGSVLMDFVGSGAIVISDGGALVRAYGGDGSGSRDGGGGRIAILRHAGPLPEGLDLVTGRYKNSGSGTTYVHIAGDPLGHLILDGERSAEATVAGTWLGRLRRRTPSTFDREARTLTDDAAQFPVPDQPAGAPGLVGYEARITFNNGSSTHFTVEDNDATSVTVSDPEDALPALIDDVVRFDLLPVLRSARFVGGAKVTNEAGLVADEVFVGDKADVSFHALVVDELEIASGGLLRPPGTSIDPGPDALHIDVEELVVAGQITAYARGYFGGANSGGYTAGNVQKSHSSGTYIGGSHASRGGNEGDITEVYGDFRNPTEFGAGGTRTAPAIVGARVAGCS